MKLSDRLETIIGMIGDAKCLADVGTDHAFVPVEAVRRGIAGRAIAADVATGPLKIAAEHIAAAGFSDRIETKLCDGLSGFEPGQADVCVIAGMGGELMRRILTDGEAVAKSMKCLILSPQSELGDFRSFLLGGGYDIDAEKCVIDDGKFYFIMSVRPGDSAQTESLGGCLRAGMYSEDELVYGRASCFDEASANIRRIYIKKDANSYKKIIERMEREGVDEEKILPIRKKLSLAERSLTALEEDIL